MRPDQIQDEPIRIGAREAQRLKERFLTRAQAVFFARIAFIAFGLGLLLVPSWTSLFGADKSWTIAIVIGMGIYTFLAQSLAGHPRLGRWALFTTLTLDLSILIFLVSNSSGLQSPAMAAMVLLTIFFALLFPNPIGIVPPLMMLPISIVLTQALPDRPSLTVEIGYVIWYAVLNGVAVYVIVYLTGREEKQNREILELEQGLKNLAVVEERNRLARDIHDGLGASLSGLIIQIEYLQTITDQDDPALCGEIKELKGSAEEAIDEVRRALTMMRDEFDLVPQLENTCTMFTTRHRLPAQLNIHGADPGFADDQQLTIFRIMQECLTNIAKHARATEVAIDVFFEQNNVKMLIADNGVGFDPSKTPKHHYGLMNMKERARKIGGQVDISSAPGEGTSITLRVQRKNPVGEAENENSSFS
jgi:two-component system, NarL family, sensor histidine kinase DegS